eukprot:2532330-Pleurochrysis_carterae.AAC.2
MFKRCNDKVSSRDERGEKKVKQRRAEGGARGRSQLLRAATRSRESPRRARERAHRAEGRTDVRRREGRPHQLQRFLINCGHAEEAVDVVDALQQNLRIAAESDSRSCI